MLLAEVIALVLAGIAFVVLEAGLCGVEYLVAEGVASHVGPDIRLIVVQEYGLGMMIVRREVAPVPRGAPRMVDVDPDVFKDRRSGVEFGPYDKVGAVDIGGAYHFEVVVVCAVDFGDEGGDILEDVVSKDSLDQEEMIVSVDGLQYAEIVDITVTVEVEVGHGILTVVEHGLELFHCACLCEESRDGLKVKLERDVFVL